MIAGTGTYSTAHSVHLTARAHELGVHGVPRRHAVLQQAAAAGDRRALRAIAEVSDRPIVVYNIPGRVVVNIEPETIAELAEIPTVTAVKQAHDDLDQARRIVETGLDLYAGDDNLVFPFLGSAASAAICVHTHVVGPQVRRWSGRSGRATRRRARRIDEELAAALRAAEGRGEPDPDQGRAEPARPRGRRLPAAARAADGRRARARARLPRARGPAVPAAA